MEAAVFAELVPYTGFSAASPDDRYTSQRDLRWDVKRHAPRLTTYTDKITSLPTPQAVARSIEQQGLRPHVSHRQFVREKMGHLRSLNRMEYTLGD